MDGKRKGIFDLKESLNVSVRRRRLVVSVFLGCEVKIRDSKTFSVLLFFAFSKYPKQALLFEQFRESFLSFYCHFFGSCLCWAII